MEICEYGHARDTNPHTHKCLLTEFEGLYGENVEELVDPTRQENACSPARSMTPFLCFQVLNTKVSVAPCSRPYFQESIE